MMNPPSQTPFINSFFDGNSGSIHRQKSIAKNPDIDTVQDTTYRQYPAA